MRILVAEDDALSARLLSSALSRTGAVVVTARNGRLAFAEALRQPFDVIVTDWMMPEMDGIELIRRLRVQFKNPPFIVMQTVLDSPHARNQALSSGADDFIAKPIEASRLIECVSLGAQRQRASTTKAFVEPDVTRPSSIMSLVDGPKRPPFVAVVIAASTGGPPAVHALLSTPALPQDCAYFVVIHGPEWMQRQCIEKLQRATKMRVALGADGIVPSAGEIYFAPGDAHLIFTRQFGLRLDHSPPENFCRPAADPLFRTAAGAFGPFAIGVVLTGLGHDGTRGAAKLVSRGGIVIAQEPNDAVAGSMPGSIIDAGFATETAPLSQIPTILARRAAALSAARRAP